MVLSTPFPQHVLGRAKPGHRVIGGVHVDAATLSAAMCKQARTDAMAATINARRTFWPAVSAALGIPLEARKRCEHLQTLWLFVHGMRRVPPDRELIAHIRATGSAAPSACMRQAAENAAATVVAADAAAPLVTAADAAALLVTALSRDVAHAPQPMPARKAASPLPHEERDAAQRRCAAAPADDHPLASAPSPLRTSHSGKRKRATPTTAQHTDAHAAVAQALPAAPSVADAGPALPFWYDIEPPSVDYNALPRFGVPLPGYAR